MGTRLARVSIRLGEEGKKKKKREKKMAKLANELSSFSERWLFRAWRTLTRVERGAKCALRALLHRTRAFWCSCSRTPRVLLLLGKLVRGTRKTPGQWRTQLLHGNFNARTRTRRTTCSLPFVRLQLSSPLSADYLRFFSTPEVDDCFLGRVEYRCWQVWKMEESWWIWIEIHRKMYV